MDSILLGYFPKRFTPIPEGMNAPSAIEIASVSECIASGPPDWVDLWTHNHAFFYDSPEIAWKSVPIDDAASYCMYGYKLASEPFGHSHVAPIDTAVTPVDIPTSFRRIGYGVVSRDYATSFECSPLSCNEMAGEYVVIEVWRDAIKRISD